MRKIIIIIFCCVAVMLAGYAGYRGYKVWKCNHLMGMAHQFLAKRDARNALLCVQQVLRTDPSNLEATQVMAELMTGARQPSALLWWNRVVDLDPHSLTNRLALAQTAILFGEYPTATNALGEVDKADVNTVLYQVVAGEVAAAGRHLAQAEAHFQEASRLDPQNETVRLNLAEVRLQGSNDLDQAQARIALERISREATNGFLRNQALRELIADALRQRQMETALSLSKQLVQETNSVFQDRLLRLGVLKEAGNAMFKPTLAAFQQKAMNNPVEVSALATWEMSKISPRDTLAWLGTLPPVVWTNVVVELPIAECYVATRDWQGLQSSIEKQNWGQLDFCRHAFLSLSLRGQGLADSAKAEWELALQAASGQEAPLIELLRMATSWRWQNESEEILWMIVNRYPADRQVVQALTQLLYSEGRTKSLMQLYSQEIKLFPSNSDMKNDLAMTALLLDKQDVKPYELAREVYQSSPTNASFASTYAFSLYKQRKNIEALKVMKTLTPGELQQPSIAGYYGLILKATGDRARARAYLDWGARAHLLPEETKLFNKAKAGL